ncbi:MAG TPA: exodeoxyribonuclease V subunit alpha [bacterium]|nr:exodeoxyribonuclease V subunit alpha [bacterium]
MENTIQLSIENIKSLTGRDAFSDIDLAFADFISKLAGQKNEYLFLAAALASYKVQRNHVCADLRNLAGRKFPSYSSGAELKKDFQPRYLEIPTVDKWREELSRFPEIVSHGEKLTPLVLDSKERLFLHKYWNYEAKLSRIIHTFIETDPKPVQESIGQISERFNTRDKSFDWQLVAMFAALRNNFTIITGGPGTGKTTIIVSILAHVLQEDSKKKIALCAPTGKAAARVKESLNDEIPHLNCSKNIRKKLQKLESSTIHRLLGTHYQSPFFEHDNKNKLIHDVIVVDESSMVDLPLMTKLMQAIRKDAKVILLGDKDQLASVESGAVFNDLCESAQINRFSQSFLNSFQECCPQHPELNQITQNEILNDHIVELRQNYRFADDQGIANLKDSIRSGRDKKSRLILKSGDKDLIAKEVPHPNEFYDQLIEYIKNLKLPELDKKFIDYKNSETLQEAWEIISSFKILCSHRRGPYGVERINKLLKSYIIGDEDLPKGLPIMITRNQPDMKLYNGDIGLIWKEDGQKRAYFPDISQPNNFRSFSISQLPVNDVVFAMTVHKSQGSGFNKVLMILPNRDSPLLTRELIYTGITRTRQECEIWTDYKLFQKAVSRQVNRNSGLRDRLKNL